MNGFRAPRPLLEGPERRPAEGEERERAEVARHRFDDAPAPAVDRMTGAVGGLAARGERVPPVAAGHAGEHDRADAGKRAAPLFVGEEEGAAGNEAGSRDGG